ncbi:MAG: UDP-N-acetylmuramate dehydrogenase [Actinomycetota bacterium]
MSGDLALASEILRKMCGDRVRTAFPMAPLTTFRIGGAASLYLEPNDEADLDAAAQAITRADIPFVVLGKGSNVLVADDGFPGLVLRLGRGYRWAARAGDVLIAGGAMPVPALAGVALQHGLAGLAFAIAIPASLGGAVRMNAGAHGAQMSDVVEEIDVYRLRLGTRVSVQASAAGFGYRESDLPPDAVVIGARLGLHAGDPQEIRAAMDEARRWRRETQPVAEPNCGSVFTNPAGAHAAALIEAAGLKGERFGGASVSSKHANFIVAEPGATAADVATLIGRIQERVEAATGIRLVPEVRVIGGTHG